MPRDFPLKGFFHESVSLSIPLGPFQIFTKICGLGYNEFDFFLENEEYRPFDGCKIEILDTITKYVFWFFEPFFARLASKFEKSTNMTFKKIFFEKIEKDVKKCRISRWFWIRWKSCKKMHTKKNYKQNKFDEHE